MIGWMSSPRVECLFVRGGGVSLNGEAKFETCEASCEAGLSGSGAGQFESPVFVAVDNSGGASAGDVYVADSGTHVVQKFTASGALMSGWGDSKPLREWRASG